MIRCVADLHTHTIASGHAYGTIREMAESASQKQLLMLGITEHAPGIPGTAGEIYYSCLFQVPRKLYGVEILFGSEVNLLDDGSLSDSDIGDSVLGIGFLLILGFIVCCTHAVDSVKRCAAFDDRTHTDD